jgi:hypothetical protein
VTAATAAGLDARIGALLGSRGAWWMLTPRDGGGVPPGAPEVLACYKGHFIAVHVRARRGRGPAIGQRRALEAMDRAGAVTLVARSVREVAAILDDIDRNPPEILALERLLA